MTDIVERIREEIDSLKVDVQVLRDAANEIEQLRTEIAAMRRQTLKNMIRHAENADMYPKL